jgi:hypothetical protein
MAGFIFFKTGSPRVSGLPIKNSYAKTILEDALSLAECRLPFL